eukprot:TRINITY_DN6514_c0_g1_i5.p1 TRINITY_DN6514_c0_g1~~TRINITY_DN6514_c0_g1_i5.p1  ORF type:complete len:661 (-),score=98.49 TRINITY_DN6514_c0_g1_i5:193-2175(-)
MYLCGQLSRLIKHYQMAVAQGGLNITNIQRQLAWIIYFSSSVLNVRSRRIVILDEMHKLTGGGLSPPPDEEVVSVETDLICMVFECMNGHDAYLGQQRSSLPPSTVHLELALISFLQKFCKNYISDDAFDSSNNFYHALEKKLGMQNPLMVIERVVQKVIFLIEKWSSSPAILEKSLGPSGLFMSLVNGWTSSKLMGKSSVITSLLKAHITINPGDDLRSHAAFYKALGRLLFSVYSDESTFYEFVAPWQEDMAKIQNYFFNVGKVPDEVHMKFRCLMEDMRGLLSSIITHLANHSGYLIFFEWFYTEMRYMDWMVELLARGADLNLEVEDAWSIISLASELAYNRQHRITFPITSADGLLLFRSIAQILINFGNLIQNANLEMDDKYKSLNVYVKCLLRSLTGGYTNFGVFELYKDPILDKLFYQSFNFIFSLDIKELEMYPKISQQIFTVLETIVSQHTTFIIQADSNSFGTILKLLLRALHSTGKTGVASGNTASMGTIITQSCDAIEKLLTLHFTNQTLAQKEHLSASSYKQLEHTTQHFKIHHNVLVSMLVQIIVLLVTTDTAQWALSRPLLPLMLLLPNDYETVAKNIIEGQKGEKRQKMADLFTHLTDGIQMTLTADNREKFLTNLIRLQKEIKEFVDLNAFYASNIQFSSLD